MMYGSHLEYALAVSELEIADLQYNAELFEYIDESYEQQHEMHIHSYSYSTNYTAEEKRTCVAHKALGGVEVSDKKA